MAATAAPRVTRRAIRDRWRSLATDTGVIVALLLGSVLMMLPFVWMFSTSWRLAKDSFNLPPEWLPTAFRYENYLEVFKAFPYFEVFLNSIRVASTVTVGQLITCSMAAFAFARLRFPGRDVLFIVVLSSMMIPGQVTIIPVFILVRVFGLLDKLEALIIPSLISAFGVFLLRQFLLTIPSELEDAAKIDGAGLFRIYSQIMLPLAGPGLSTLAIFTFNFHWNEFFRPLIFLSSPEKMTLPLGLTLMRGYLGATGNVSAIMAGITLALLPVLIVFLLAQRYLIEGITLTGLKG